MITIKENFNLKQHNTFGMDVLCRLWIEYTSPKDLIEIFSADYPAPFKSIGGGSNLLFCNDYAGTLLYNNITDIEVKDSNILRVGGGVTMDDLIQHTISQGLWGVENLSGIPGTVGAAAVQNIGAYGVELSDAVQSVEVFDTKDRIFKVISKDQCGYGYRKSIFKTTEKDRYAVTHVNLQLSRQPMPHLDYAHLRTVVANPEDQSEIRNAVIGMRDSKLPNPKVYGNAGSFFMNPVLTADKYQQLSSLYPNESVHKYDAVGGVKVPAAWLIDKAGWRGCQLGGAAVWSKQPLVLVNMDGNASPQDIIALKDAIIQDINYKFGITLTPEVEIL